MANDWTPLPATCHVTGRLRICMQTTTASVLAIATCT
jgi:hypothetical protein